MWSAENKAFAVGGHRRTSFAHAQGKSWHEVATSSLTWIDDTASDCSTSLGQNLDASREDDDYSDSGAEACPEAVSLQFFDWDDTLCPTTWIEQQGLLDGGVATEEHQRWLETLAESSSRTLKMAMRCGRVVIVTNAGEGWVELSCSTFMPSLMHVLQDVEVVSARSLYEHPCLQDPSDWKRLAFTSEVERFYAGVANGPHRNIISCGDSMYEQHALNYVTQGVLKCWGKSMKFIERPTVEQLVEQHEVLNRSFLDFVAHPGNLDFEIGPEEAWV